MTDREKRFSRDKRVAVVRCPSYDRKTLEAAMEKGMALFDFRPHGDVFVKPNAVFAQKEGEHARAACTHHEVLAASLTILSKDKAVQRVDVGEKTAVGYPTRLIMEYAGFLDAVEDVRQKAACPVGLFSIEEELRDPVFVGGAVHDVVRVPRKLARADTVVYLPKLKCHCVSTMTGAVKLNIGILSDDERSIRHDFMLNDKIVDLLSAGYPDFVIMDAVEVGVGNEALPTSRPLGLLVMGRNPLAVDLVGARLLGYSVSEVPYLQRAVERGWGPARVEEVELLGDLTSLSDLDEASKGLGPRDGEFTRWQDVAGELARLESPLRFLWGQTPGIDGPCRTGCVMGIKMFLGFLERYAGPEAFRNARPSLLVVGRHEGEIDARGGDVFLIGSCARARIANPGKVTNLDNCFVTAVDLALTIRGRLGVPTPATDRAQLLPLFKSMLMAVARKIVSGRYIQDLAVFVTKRLIKRI